MGTRANYGYKDGSGDYFIEVDTDRCDGCGRCAEACRWGVMEVGEDENDPLRETPVARVAAEHRKRIKYSCTQCKPVKDRKTEPCRAACPRDALAHSW